MEELKIIYTEETIIFFLPLCAHRAYVAIITYIVEANFSGLESRLQAILTISLVSVLPLCSLPRVSRVARCQTLNKM